MDRPSFKPRLEVLEDRLLLAPVLGIPGTQANQEGQSALLQIYASDSLALTYSASGLPGGLSINASTGLITGIFGYANASGGSTATTTPVLTVSDGASTVSGSFSWKVADTDRLPSFFSETSSEGQTASLSMAGTDYTGTNSLTYSASNLPQGLSINASTGIISGVVGYGNANSATTIATFSSAVTLTDNHGGTDLRSFGWSVSNTPLLTATSWFGSEGTTVSLYAGSDHSGTNGLTYSATSLPQGLSINASTGLISGLLGYANVASGSTASLASSLSVANGGGQIESKSLPWTIGDTDRISSLSSQSNSEGQTVSLSVNATDLTGTNSLTYSASGLPQGLSINTSTGLISGVVGYHNASSSSSYVSFSPTVTLTDNHGGTDTRAFSWGVSDTTLLTLSSDSGAEGSTVSVYAGSDHTGTDGLTYSVSGLPSGLSVNASTGLISGMPGYANASGGVAASLTATLSIGDTLGLIQSKAVSWSIADTDRLPTPSFQSNSEGQTVSLNMAGTDNTGTNSLTYSASGLPQGLSINASTGLISGVVGYHNASSSSSYVSFSPTVTLTDNHGGTDTRAFSWSVSDTTLLTLFSDSGAEGSTVSLYAGSDHSGTDGLTYSASNLPQGLSINASTGLIGGIVGYSIATGSSSGSLSSSFTVGDALGFIQGSTASWTISNTNRLPTISSQSGTEGNAVSLDVHGTDNTGTNSLTYSASALPHGLSINASTGLISGLIAFDNVTGTNTLAGFGPTVTLTDGHGGTDTRAFMWSVSKAPALTLASASSTEGTAVSLYTGPDHTGTNGLTYSASALPQGLSINASTGLISGIVGYSITAGGSTASLSSAVTVSYSLGLIQSAGLSWTIADTDRLPTPGTQSDSEGQAVTLNMAGTDNTGTNSLTYSASALPQGLSINASTGLISGVLGFHNASSTTPTVGFSPTVTLKDDHGGTDTRGFTWSIVDTQLLTLSSASGIEGDTVSLYAGLYHTSTDGLTYSASSLPQGLSIDVSTGLISGIAGYANSSQGLIDSIFSGLMVGDALGLIQGATLSWAITDTDRLPTPPPQSNSEGQTVSLNMAGTDDTGTNSLTYSASALPTGLSIDASTGLISGTLGYNNVTGSSASVSVSPTVTLTDNHGGTDTRSLAWTVRDSLGVTGTAFVALEGVSFSGGVASFVGNAGNSPSNYAATILWGDGATSSGVVSATGGGFLVSGTHTYPKDGSYAVAVLVSDSSNGGYGTATTMGAVVRLDDARFQVVQGNSLAYQSTAQQSGTDAAGSFNLTETGTLSYQLQTTQAVVGGGIQQSQSVSFLFTLAEAGSDSASSITLGGYSINETGSRGLTIGTSSNDLVVNSSTTEQDTVSLTLNESGNGTTGAFSQTLSESTGGTLTGSGTDSTGTFSLTQSVTGSNQETLTGSYSSGTYSLTGTITRGLSGPTTGNSGPVQYTQGETATSTIGVSESGTISTGTFTRTETESDSDSLGTTGTDLAGSDTETETDGTVVTRVVSGSNVTKDWTSIESSSGSSSSGETGTEQTDSYTESDSDTFSGGTRTETGNESTGTYTLTESATDGFTQAENDSNQGETASEGGSGTTHSTVGESGNVVSGSVSRSDSENTTDTETGSDSDQGATSGSTMTDTSNTSTTETGNYLSGAYTLTPTGTDISTTTESDSNQGDTSSETLTDTQTLGGGETGNSVTGAYSITNGGTDVSTTTEGESNQGDVSSATIADTQTLGGSESGNSITGAYSITNGGTDVSTTTESDSNQGDTSSETMTDTQTLGGSESGNSVTGVYAITNGGTDVSTTTEDDSNQGDVSSATIADTQTLGGSESGNSITGAYSITNGGSDVSTTTEGDSNQGDTSNETMTDTQALGGSESGNSITGAYSITNGGSDVSTTTESDSNQGDTSSETMTDTQTLGGSESGNSVTGAYSITNGGTDVSTTTEGDSNQGDVSSATIADSQTLGGSESGNSLTGAYTVTNGGTDVSTTTEGDSNQGDTSSETMTDTQTLGGGGTGNSVTGAYTVTNGGTDVSTTTEGDSNQGDVSSATIRDTQTLGGGETGNSLTGAYTVTNGGTDVSTTTESDSNQGDTSSETMTDTQTLGGSESGNSITGAYVVTNGGTDVSTTTEGESNQGDVSSATIADTQTLGGSETGNSITGAYAITNGGSDVSTTTESDSNQGTTGTGTIADTSTLGGGETGNSLTGVYTITNGGSDVSTTTESDSSTLGTTSTDTITETITPGGGETGNSISGTSTTTDTSSDVVTEAETGTDASGDPYTLNEGDSTTQGTTGTFNTLTGAFQTTTTTTPTDTLVENGSNASGSYHLTETVSNTDTQVESGNEITGTYTATDNSTDGTTTSETGSHSGGSTSYTETISIGGTVTESGNTISGTLGETATETTSTSLAESDSEASGTVTVSENGTATTTDVESGNSITGSLTDGSTGSDSYSLVESGTKSGATFTLTETGSDGSTDTETGNEVTGLTTQTESGTDGYSLIETGTNGGGAFSQTVSGSDGWTLGESDDAGAETSSLTESGGGSYTEVDSGAGATKTSGSGTLGFSLTEAGDWRAGDVSQTETGTDRYALLEAFANVASSSNGKAGHLDYSPTDSPFQDPPPLPFGGSSVGGASASGGLPAGFEKPNGGGYTQPTAPSIPAPTPARGASSAFGIDFAHGSRNGITAPSDPGTNGQASTQAPTEAATPTDTSGQTTRVTYDAQGNETSSAPASGPAPAGTTSADYQNGHVVQVVDADGNTTTYGYDSQGRLVSTTDALGNTQTQTYDAQGNVASITNRNGLRRDFTYDAEGREIGETWYAADGTTVTNTVSYTYNSLGQLTSAGDDSGTYTFAYDAQGRLASVQGPFGVSLTFGYDSNGNRILVQDSFGGTTTSQYDAANELVGRWFAQDGTPLLGITQSFDSNGNVIQQTRTDGTGATAVTTTYGYDAAGNLTNLTHTAADGTVIAAYSYIYDAAGDLISETEQFGIPAAPADPASTGDATPSGTTDTSATAGSSATTNGYSYDASGELTSANGQTWTYDANGNRTNAGTVIGPDNRLLSDGVWNYAYDADGNTISKTSIATGETWSYGYDAKDRMVSAVHRDAAGVLISKAQYGYDVFDHRIVEIDTDAAGVATETHFAYDGDQLFALLDAGNHLVKRYVSLDALDSAVARVGADGSVNWLLADRLGSIRDIVDNSGSVIDHIDYDAWGNITNETAPQNGDQIGYAGYWYEATVGLYQVWHRWYNPMTDRWTSEDQTSFAAGDSNLYRVVGNDVTNATDPSGLDIFYLVDPSGAGGFGHAGLIIGPVSSDVYLKHSVRFVDKKGEVVSGEVVRPTFEKGNPKEWYIYISVDIDPTIFTDGSWAKFLPGRGGVPIKLDVEYGRTLSELLDINKIKKRYSAMLQVQSSSKQDADAIKLIGERWDNAGYRLLWNNCSNLALDAMIAAKIIKGAPLFPGPNARAKLLSGLYLAKSSKAKQWWVLVDGKKWEARSDAPITEAKWRMFQRNAEDNLKIFKGKLAGANKQIQDVFGKLFGD